MTFDEEAWPRLRFANNANPLKVVVAQVRFPLAHSLNTPDVHAGIQRSLGGDFPKSLDPIQEVTFAVTAQGPTAPQIEHSAIRFGDAAAKKVVAIGPSMGSFETTQYEGWENFRPEVERVLELVAQHGAPTEYTRFGLRYVDELKVEGVTTVEDWAQILTTDVLGNAGSLLQDPRIAETSQQGRIRIGEDEIRFRHGYVGRQEPDSAQASVYVIDTDISTSVVRAWDVAEILARADRYHTWVTNIFGRSLSPAGLERLGGTNR